MGHLLANIAGRARKRGTSEQAGSRTIVLLLALLLGFAACGFWFYARAKRNASGAAGETPASLLSDSTKAVLGRLNSPLEIHFYALLDPATVPGSLTAFADRVGQWLAAYQQEAGGKIKLTSFNAESNPNAHAAMADGITVFNLDKGEACYLGITLVLNGRKETLPYLSPEWEQALEPDVTRAIIRLLDGAPPITAPTAVSQINTAAVQEVRSLITNLDAVSVQRGREILQDAAIKDFTAAAKEMQMQVKEAEQRLTQAQNGGTDAERQAAIKHLQQVQAEQTQKLKQIAARSKAQVDTFQQLKAAPH